MTGDGDRELRETLPGRPDCAGLDARLALAELRAQMFRAVEPVRLDRHRLIRLLGRGAHGRVFEAEDTELERRIALKVMRPDDPVSDTPRPWLREAQSLAKLSHPHVVEVYDAGIADDQLWIAMELVRGITAAEWARRNPPGSAERFDRIRTILDHAASGVSAAHDRGLIHRDLKPSNILVGDDGRARVADFGLARSRLVPTGRTPPENPEDDALMTAVAGTPRYMSPEQLRGDPVDAASDQFGFAVTAWELVFGAHPFAGLEPSVLAHASELRPVRPPTTSGVPAAYARALRRALDPDPAQRFGSMEDLRRALRPRSRARWLAGAAAGLVVVAASVGMAGLPVDGNGGPPSCDPAVATERLAEVWNDDRRVAVQEGLHVSGLLDAPETTRAVMQELDAHAEAWIAQSVESCEGRWVDRTLDDARLDARVTCLRRSAHALDALLSHLEDADASTAAHALASARSLPSPSECAEASGRSTPSSPRHDALSTRLAEARADLTAGRYAMATTKAESIAAEATDAGLGTLAADAHDVAGTAWGELYDPRRFASFEAAYYAAAELTDGRELARHANSLAMQHAYHGALDLAEEWARHADAGLRRHPDELQRLRREHVRGLLQLKRGERPTAAATFQRVLDELEAGGLENDELTWLARLARLAMLRGSGRPDEVEALAQRLRQQTVDALGPSHPRLARLSLALASSARERSDLATAIEHLEKAVRLSEQGYGAANPRTGLALFELGWTHAQAGDLDAAEQCYRRGLETTAERDGPLRVRLQRGLGTLCSARNDHHCAELNLQASVSTARRVWPDGSLELARTTRHLAEILLQRGRPDEAAHHLRAVVQDLGSSPPAPDLARTVVDLSEARAKGAEVPKLDALRERAVSSCAASTSSWCRRLTDPPETTTESAAPSSSGSNSGQ